MYQPIDNFSWVIIYELLRLYEWIYLILFKMMMKIDY